MTLTLKGRIMPASNATFLAELDGVEVVYKPVAGERPLWDFPDETLARREVAAYLVSEETGWDVVPRTWIGEGPHGPGMVQEWQTVVEDDEPVTLVAEGEVPAGWCAVFDGYDAQDRPITLIHEDTAPLRRMALFDVVVNNADRKGGHVLAMPAGHRYGVDHGLTFHHEPKLRTVLWGWAAAPLTVQERDVLEHLAGAVRGDLGRRLADHLVEEEIEAVERRIRALRGAGVLPAPSGGWPAIPWPPF
ncbi:SCO1664 family protein [Nocardioides sambongensis]|uniref:SCO1664 family protein n=1 Tax=Nocardioides sambongensis TaxID=2589074 RepID=UPI001E51AC10|nr:SCO1664 family protein [Nocardioides sambongensis]